MFRLAAALMAACALIAGCGDDDNTTAPSNLPVVFSAQLRPANEVPAIANAEASGLGAVQVQFDVTRDSGGAITAATATFYFQLSGFPSGTTTVGAHIHPGPAGVNGPVIVNTGITAASSLALTNGSAETTIRGIAVTPAVAESIIANPGAFYFNVHSPTNPGGFARGQLERVQ
jgi:CHRD domain-containing protein